MEQQPLTHRTPLRNRFRFSLRTLFVLVTLFSIYLWWALDWKRQRQEFLQADDVRSDYVKALTPIQQHLLAPVALWMIGEQGCEYLLMDYPTEEQRREAGRLFPEAKVLSSNAS